MSFSQPLNSIATRRPIALVPHHHGAAAVLALGDGPFEVAVLQWMIFDLNREPLVARIVAGPLVTAQLFSTPSQASLKS